MLRINKETCTKAQVKTDKEMIARLDFAGKGMAVLFAITEIAMLALIASGVVVL